MRPPFDEVEDLKTTPDVRDQSGGLGRLLVSWEGGHRVMQLPAAGRLTVGRSVECEVRIDHASVSRKHAIVHLGHPLRVQDLGSSNGARIGGRRLAANTTAPLSPGEVVELVAKGTSTGLARSAVIAPPAPPAPPATPPQGGAEGAGLRSEVELFERQRILDALERCRGNQTQAAKLLGISRRTLIDRLDAYDLPRPRKGRGPADA